MDSSNKKTRSSVKSCLTTILLVGLGAVGCALFEISRNKLKCEIIKSEIYKKDTVPQQMKDGTIVHGPDTLKFDTLKIEKNKKSYISWLKKHKQKIIEGSQNVR